MYRRFEKPKPVKQLVLTERDMTVIRACYQFRLVTTDQLMKLTGTASRTNFNARLRDLWAAGYIDRPELQRLIFAYRDSRPIVHALGQKGAKWLATNDGVRFPKGKGWQSANQLKSVNYLEHRLGVADTVLRFREDLEGKTGYRFIDKDELLLTSPGATQRKRYPWLMPTKFTLPTGKEHVRGTLPDYTFAIGSQGTERERRALFFLEWDNSTEDFVRSDPDQSMILGLYLRYADVYRRKLQNDFFGFNNFRVAIVVNGAPERLAKMIGVYQAHAAQLCPAGSFLHTTQSDLDAHGALGRIWKNGKGRTVEILPSQESCG